MIMIVFYYGIVDLRVLHVLTHSFPTRRSSDLTLAGLAAVAIGDRDEARRQRREAGDAAPQALLHLGALRREELEGDLQRARAAGGIGSGVWQGGHAAALLSERVRAAMAAPGLRARQICTVRSEEPTSELQSLMRTSY